MRDLISLLAVSLGYRLCVWGIRFGDWNPKVRAHVDKIIRDAANRP